MNTIEFSLRNIDANGQLTANVDCSSDGRIFFSDRLTLDSYSRRRTFANLAAEKYCGPSATEETRQVIATQVEAILDRRLESRIREIEDDDEQPPDDESNTPKFLTQQGNAEELITLHRGTIRFNASSGRWIIWRKGKWIDDERGEVENFAKQQARGLWGLVAEPPGGISRDAAIKHIVKSETAAGVNGTLKLARSEVGISVTAAELDANGWALNCLNGTIDLRTGTLRPHRAEDLATKQCPVAFDPQATAPLWESVLHRSMGGNQSLINYLRRLAGTFLTADVTNQEIYIFHGPGANGKSIFCDTFSAIMDEYAGEAAPSLLTARNFDEHPTEFADLAGRRLVIASETEEGARLRIQLVKRLTGNATIKGRYMRQDFFKFPRTHKLVLVTNHKPIISETSHAIWRRVRLIPFTVTIPLSERDPQLLEKLRAEWSGILAWAVRGCLEWQRDGMQTPDEVMLATTEYQREQDPIAEFVSDWCQLGEGNRLLKSDLWSAYQSYVSQINERHPLSRSSLFEQIRRLPGVEDGQWRPLGTDIPTRGFKGIQLTKHGGIM